jgi:DNA polymerase
MDKSKSLDELKTKMRADTTLPLRNVATNLVFGDGNPDSEILFIGEGPGYWEDVKGIPFVGNAGALLNQLLAKIGIQRKDVYITNIIHYRAPENRDPEPSEIKAFGKYLDEIIKIINPKIIITLGRFSMAKFLPGVFISSTHGKEKIVEWEGKPLLVIPMYHPAAALRNTEVKLKLIDDFEKIPKLLQNIKEKGDRIQEDQAQTNSVKQLNLV